jgi:hypothetical protein
LLKLDMRVRKRTIQNDMRGVRKPRAIWAKLVNLSSESCESGLGKRRSISFAIMMGSLDPVSLLSRAVSSIKQLKTPYYAPRVNAIGERFLGSVRRACLNYIRPSAKAPVIDPGDEAPFLVWGGERANGVQMLDRDGKSCYI